MRNPDEIRAAIERCRARCYVALTHDDDTLSGFYTDVINTLEWVLCESEPESHFAGLIEGDAQMVSMAVN